MTGTARRFPVLPEQPGAGVVLHLTSLPGAHGMGDIGDAALDFLDRLHAMGMGVWQFLPTGPTGYGDSPYQPLSVFAGNELLVGLEPLARAGLLRREELAPLADLPHGTVDFARLIPARRALLDRAAERFAGRAGEAWRGDYAQFREQHGPRWLDDYALYRVLKTRHAERAWPEWAPQFAGREPAALQRVRGDHHGELERIRVLQYLFHRQWRGLARAARERGIRLFGDLPIYIALDSADAWAQPGLLQLHPDGRPRRVAGVPPDYFAADGQLWGNPLYDWDAQARNGYRWWVERMQHAASMFPMVRVDHFRGFEAYWSVPQGEPNARNGRWEPGPGDALFRVLGQALDPLPIVAEDLGEITDAVHALRLRHGIPGMRVLQFEVDAPDFDPGAIEEGCVLYTGTHDNDTTVGWFRGSPDELRSPAQVEASRRAVLSLTGGRPETIHSDLFRLALGTPARLALAPMQDVLGLGSEARLNRPGTTLDNWRWRLRPGELTDELMAEVRGLVEEAGRG